MLTEITVVTHAFFLNCDQACMYSFKKFIDENVYKQFMFIITFIIISNSNGWILDIECYQIDSKIFPVKIALLNANMKQYFVYYISYAKNNYSHAIMKL